MADFLKPTEKIFEKFLNAKFFSTPLFPREIHPVARQDDSANDKHTTEGDPPQLTKRGRRRLRKS